MRMFLFCCLVGASLITTSCSSGEEDTSTKTKGLIRLSVTADAAFGTATRAVDENSYTDVNKYTVQILDTKDNSVKRNFFTVKPLPPSNSVMVHTF